MQKHPILFVGAGPGDPDLITVKGQKALKEADLVIYAGSLVPDTLLKWTGIHAEKISSASMNLNEIIEKIREGYDRGKRVVRLHTGDPSIYGAVFEQMAELSRYEIPYEVIPGVTAAFAAAAAIGLEYTLPRVSQTLILTRIAGRTPVPELESLEGLAAHQTSMAIYLSMGQVKKVSEILAKHYGRKAPCIVACRVSHPEEIIIRAAIEDLAEVSAREKIDRHALIIVGKVLEVTEETLEYKSKLYDKDFSHGYRDV